MSEDFRILKNKFFIIFSIHFFFLIQIYLQSVYLVKNANITKIWFFIQFLKNCFFFLYFFFFLEIILYNFFISFFFLILLTIYKIKLEALSVIKLNRLLIIIITTQEILYTIMNGTKEIFNSYIK